MIYNNKEIFKIELRSFLALALISPVIAITHVFRFKTERFFIRGTTISMGLFGLFFSYPKGSDGHSHLMNSIDHYTNMGFVDFFVECWNIIIQSPTYDVTDLYIHFLSFFSNSFLNLPYTLHFWAGLVLGYVISKTIIEILGVNSIKSPNKITLALLIIFILVYTIYSLNAIRISTAGWIALYAAVSLYYKNKRLAIILFLLAIQVHLALAVMVLPILLGFALKSKKKLVLIIWFLSFFFQSSFSVFESYLPETDVVNNKTKYYVLDQDKLESFNEQTDNNESNFYTVLGPKLYYKFGIPVLLISFIFIYMKSNNKLYNLLFTVSILLYSFSNLVPYVPSLQGRLVNLSSLFLIFLIIKYYIDLALNNSNLKIAYDKFNKVLVFVFILLSTPFLLKNISHIINTTEPFILALPLLSVFTNESFSIKDLIIIFI